ncbi:MAG: SH3 domain-containing protein [Chthoniobacterales bacterium]
MKNWLICFFCVTWAVTGFGADSQSSPGEQSVSQIEERLRETGPSPQLYYHLAVAEESAGDIVDAALNYQRAIMLDPGMRVAQNRFAAFASKNNIGVRPRSWQDDVVSVVHPETLLVLGMVLGWAGAIALAWMIFSAPKSRWYVAISVFALLLGSALFSMGYVSDPRIADANLFIISSGPEVKVLSGPAENSSTVVTLNPGSAVGVVSPRGAWTYVATPGGAAGWIPSDRLIKVIPDVAGGAVAP